MEKINNLLVNYWNVVESWQSGVINCPGWKNADISWPFPNDVWNQCGICVVCRTVIGHRQTQHPSGKNEIYIDKKIEPRRLGLLVVNSQHGVGGGGRRDRWCKNKNDGFGSLRRRRRWRGWHPKHRGRVNVQLMPYSHSPFSVKSVRHLI